MFTIATADIFQFQIQIRLFALKLNSAFLKSIKVDFSLVRELVSRTPKTPNST